MTLRRLVPLAALVLLTCLLAFEPAADRPRAAVSPALRTALAGGEKVSVWVHFRDKGLNGADREAALAAVAAEMPERTRQRRAKVRPAGPLVDDHDLPVNPRYLARAAATGAVLDETSRWLNAASFTADAGQAARLAALPEVARLDRVRTLRPAAIPTPVETEHSPPPRPKAATVLDYGANLANVLQINVAPLHEQGLSGAGVVVGLLDTGFGVTHESLQHVPVAGQWDFVDDDPVVDFEPGDPSNVRYHGTAVLSTVAAFRPGQLIAPAYGATVLLARTEDVSQEVPAEEDDWVAGLEWAEFLGADIVTSSLGYVNWYTFDDLDGNTAVTTVAADLAVGRGLVVVNSAGNDRQSSGHLIAPADGDSVLTVGAVNISGFVASFSSPGPTADGRIKPDVAALGVAAPVADPYDDQNYGALSGTSFSCPITASVVALMLERVPQLTPMQVREALRMTASQAAAPDNDLGWGIVDAWAAATWWGPVFAHDPLPDTTDDLGPYPVEVAITDREGLDAATAAVHWRADGGPWNATALAPTGAPDTYGAAIPGHPVGTVIEYYLQASGLNGITAALPGRAGAAPFAFQVQDWTTVDLPSSGAAAVPDGVAWGLESVIDVPVTSSGDIVSVGVSIDLDHPDLGEIEIMLTGPDGTEVGLYQRDDPGTSGLTGDWPGTLAESGPGSLADFAGRNNKGAWTLTVVDPFAGNAGTLQGWTLHFVLANYVSPVRQVPAVPGVTLLPNVPNPFNPRTDIRFELGAGGRTRLTIFDARGMLVRRLVDAHLDPGPHVRTWDGRDDAGRAVPSGTYLYRLERGDAVQARKMLLMR
jgi:subtilisin-like proprotein convertase family protein